MNELFTSLDKFKEQVEIMINMAVKAKGEGDKERRETLIFILRGIKNLQQNIMQIKKQFPSVYQSWRSDIENIITLLKKKVIGALVPDSRRGSEKLLDGLDFITSLKPRKLMAELQAFQKVVKQDGGLSKRISPDVRRAA
jgi:hypothetical protein